nr:MAG TPA: Protein of unknown function (DUF551) [Caudoviricetes sp.]
MAGRVNELLAELRGCGETLDCRGCKRANSPVLCQSLVAEAADMLQEYVDRCARYAEETMELREKQQWVSVTKRLPVPGDRVLAAKDGAFVGESYLSESGVWRRYYGALWVLLGCAPVTHWMPLPDAPEVTCDG